MQRWGHQREQERHQATFAARALATESGVAVVAEENKRSAQLQVEDDLAEELVVGREDTSRVLADWTGQEAMFVEQFPVFAPQMVQVAEAEVTGGIATVARRTRSALEGCGITPEVTSI